MKGKYWPCLFALLLIGADAVAVEPHTGHTFRLVEGEPPPEASLQDAAWLAGSWTGTAFGKRFEEVWNPPSAGSVTEHKLEYTRSGSGPCSGQLSARRS